MRDPVAISVLFLLLSCLVAADLPSCERARCTHCESQFVARLCVDTCRLCHITKTDPRRPAIRGEPISETGVIQSGLNNLHVISQQTNSAPVAQQPPHHQPPQPAQLPSPQAPQQVFNPQPQFQQPQPQAPTQLYYPQQQVAQPQFPQPQPQQLFAPQPQQQFVAQPQLQLPQPPQAQLQLPQAPQAQLQLPQPQQPQPQFYTFAPYQAPAFGTPAGAQAQQSFFFNPFQPFLPYSPTPLTFPGQPAPALPAVQPFGGFSLPNISQPAQPAQPANAGFVGQPQPQGAVGTGAGAGAGAQQSKIPPSPPPPANLIDSQNYQYQRPAQSVAQPQPQPQNPYPQQLSATNRKVVEPVNIQPQQVRTAPPPPAPQPEQHIVNTVTPATFAPPVEVKTTTAPAALQCPRQPNWQPCISKDLANERFRNCCQRLGEGCVSLCSYDQNLTTIQIAVLTGRCPISKVADMMICASGYEDATPCCQAYNVFEPGFEHCKPYCNPAAGLPQGGMLSEQYKCLGKLSQIQQCFYVTQRP